MTTAADAGRQSQSAKRPSPRGVVGAVGYSYPRLNLVRLSFPSPVMAKLPRLLGVNSTAWTVGSCNNFCLSCCRPSCFLEIEDVRVERVTECPKCLVLLSSGLQNSTSSCGGGIIGLGVVGKCEYRRRGRCRGNLDAELNAELGMRPSYHYQITMPSFASSIQENRVRLLSR